MRLPAALVPLSVVLLSLACVARAPAARSTQLPDGFRAAAGVANDDATGLPMRVVHSATGIELVLIQPGAFAKETVAEPFYIGVTEVTTGQFRRFVDATGYQTDAERGTPEGNGHGRGSFTSLPDGEREWSEGAQWRTAFANYPEFKLVDDVPVMHASWNDAHAFADRYGMRLPTELEWEYAARAGRTTLYPWGDSPAGGAAKANVRDQTAASRFGQPEVVFPFDDRTLRVAEAASYEANAWGLYDTIGNLAEWVEGSWNDSRILRGGSWCDYPDGASFESRAGMHSAARRDFIGFRVAMSP